MVHLLITARVECNCLKPNCQPIERLPPPNRKATFWSGGSVLHVGDAAFGGHTPRPQHSRRMRASYAAHGFTSMATASYHTAHLLLRYSHYYTLFISKHVQLYISTGWKQASVSQRNVIEEGMYGWGTTSVSRIDKMEQLLWVLINFCCGAHILFVLWAMGKWVTGKSNLVERGHKKCPTGNLNGFLLTQKLLRLFLCDNLVTKKRARLCR